MMLFLVFQHKSRKKTVRYQKLNYKCTFIVLNEYRYTRFLSFCLFFNFFLSLEIRLNSVVQSKQSVDPQHPLPLGALRQLTHFASPSYATATVQPCNRCMFTGLSIYGAQNILLVIRLFVQAYVCKVNYDMVKYIIRYNRSVVP